MRVWVIALIVAAHITSVSGQATKPPVETKPASAKPDLSLSFEVASVKPSASSVTRGLLSLRPGTFIATNYTLNELIAFAFDVIRLQVVGAPKWANSRRWSINARTPPGFRWLEEHQAMLRGLLETRFALKHRREVRNLPIYELRRARKDGSLGPNLTAFEGECKRKPADPQGIRCYFRVSQNVADAVGADWADLNLAGQLTGLDRLVFDKTGLVGKFNVQLRPEASDSGRQDVSLFTALREQLGLRLEPTTGPVQVIVIEAAQLPDPD